MKTREVEARAIRTGLRWLGSGAEGLDIDGDRAELFGSRVSLVERPGECSDCSLGRGGVAVSLSLGASNSMGSTCSCVDMSATTLQSLKRLGSFGKGMKKGEKCRIISSL